MGLASGSGPLALSDRGTRSARQKEERKRKRKRLRSGEYCGILTRRVGIKCDEVDDITKNDWFHEKIFNLY